MICMRAPMLRGQPDLAMLRLKPKLVALSPLPHAPGIMMNRYWMPLVGLMLLMTGCTGLGSKLPRIDDVGDAPKAEETILTSSDQATSRLPSDEPTQTVVRPVPYDDLPVSDSASGNSFPGFSSSPYGVDPIPKTESVVDDSVSPPYELPAVEAPMPPEEIPSAGVYQVKPPAPSPPPAPKTFSLSAPPAVLALENEIEGSLRAGGYGEAAASLERAIRIQPKNPELWHVLADVRLKQHQPGLAEDLAKKSNLLAKNNAELIRSNWIIIAESRRLKGDVAGASEALDMARQ